MYAVGKISSYITQGVYTVSGPFHPFGGAVDMVVVQQQDGTLKSSPWYVKFGKFQGVLKAKERVVDINVNGVNADFHMYLDPRGEAYFLREVDSEIASPISSTCEEIERKDNGKMKFKSKSMNYDLDDQCDSVGSEVSNGTVLARNNSKRSRILGFVLGRRSMKEHMLSNEENNDSTNAGRIASIESAQIAADLLEMNWSTNRSSRNKFNKGSSNNNGEITGGRLEASLVLHEQHFVNKLEGSRIDENIVSDAPPKDVDEEHNFSVEYYEQSSITRLDNYEQTLEIISGSGTEVASSQQGDTSVEVVSCSSVAVSVCQTDDDEHRREEVDELNDIDKPPLESNCEFQDVPTDPVLIKEVSETLVEEQIVFNDTKARINETRQELDEKYGPDPIRIRQQRFKLDVEGPKGNNIRRCTSIIDIQRKREDRVIRKAKSLPNMWSRFDDPNPDIHDDSQFYSPVTRFRTSKWDIVRDDASRITKGNLEKELPQGAHSLSTDIKDGGTSDINGAGGSWSLWPFRRSVNKLTSPKDEDSKKDCDVGNVVETDVEKETPSPQSSSSKTNTRALTPTPEQLASLNLAEGRNTVTFTFSTSVLGPQKVDARIYLWRWDTRIVISDVDGTITKSDVLGQFMPLVGRDWSHIGVTHLFSGIKENGYQMMYLSARAISQASITRQFLFNLKQDGKALPDGPVVISPDGLFPSLFREVIRRAPHEFKIACLEDIKACFPPDRNPFYAGFGNRDTDEFSYLKVGIPKGKIFIINPKGEVVVNRCIDSKSYASLHALVNDIFPPISVHEEEDYNSWNFWKLPPPDIE